MRLDQRRCRQNVLMGKGKLDLNYNPSKKEIMEHCIKQKETVQKRYDALTDKGTKEAKKCLEIIGNLKETIQRIQTQAKGAGRV